jgi:hypothetical protein
MSDFAALSAISLLFVLGTSVFFYLSNKTNDLGYQILTGVVGGAPIPAKQRLFMLYNHWAPYGSGVVSVGVFLTFAQLQFATHAGNENVKLLAYMAAFLAAVSALGWLVLGISVFFNPSCIETEHSPRRHQALPGEGTVLTYGLGSQGSVCFGLALFVAAQFGAVPGERIQADCEREDGIAPRKEGSQVR